MALPIYTIRALALLGFLLNAHFIYTHHLRKEEHRHTMLCAGDKCTSLVKTRYARIFYVPNYVLSVFYYAALIAVSFTLFFTDSGYRIPFLALVWFVAAMSLYLTYILVAKLKTRCMVCLGSAAINLMIAVLFSLI